MPVWPKKTPKLPHTGQIPRCSGSPSKSQKTNGTGTNGMGINGTGTNGTGTNDTGTNGTGTNGTGTNGTGINGTGTLYVPLDSVNVQSSGGHSVLWPL